MHALIMNKTKEQMFLELIDGYSIEISVDSFPNSFIMNGKYKKFKIFFYGQKDAVCDHYGFWKLFEDEYNMSHNEIKLFLNKMLFKYFNIDRKFSCFIPEPLFDGELEYGF